jgi:hypothetical protein
LKAAQKQADELMMAVVEQKQAMESRTALAAPVARYIDAIQ